jgi:hypothetical protein
MADANDTAAHQSGKKAECWLIERRAASGAALDAECGPVSPVRIGEIFHTPGAPIGTLTAIKSVEALT